MQNKKDIDSWENYYNAVGDSAHHKCVEDAVKYVLEKDFALDIGAGNLRDTKYLLSEGFKVVAVDLSPLSAQKARELAHKNLEFFEGFIGAYSFPENRFSFVNAQGMLFHFSEPHFSHLIKMITRTTKQGGIFCANFIGKNHTWNYPGTTKTIVDKEDILKILSDFEILSFKEEEWDETLEFAKAKGATSPKHWHDYFVIAKKK